jgi:hypothetical protein
MSQNTSDPDRIERDLGETRARLDSRLSELQERLSPGQILDDLMRYFRGSEGADFGRNLLDNVKSNPLPAAVTGIGLAWLMASNQRPQQATYGTDASFTPATSGSGRVRVSGSAYGSAQGSAQTAYNATAERLRLAEQGVVRQQDEAESAYTTRLDEARGRALGLTQQAQETAASFSQRVKDAISSATQSVAQGASAASTAVTQGAHDLRDQVSGAAQSAAGRASGHLAYGGQAAQDLGGRLASTLSDSPILLGALGLAAGALLGALIPQSREEEDALGNIAGQVRGTARGAAQEAIDRGSRVAQAVVDAGRQSVSDKGLAGQTSVGGLVDAALSGKLAGTAGEVARDALRAADEAARKEGLDPASGSGSTPSASGSSAKPSASGGGSTPSASGSGGGSGSTSSASGSGTKPSAT